MYLLDFPMGNTGLEAQSASVATGLLHHKMTLTSVASDDLAGTGNFEPLSGCFPCPYLRHSVFPFKTPLATESRAYVTPVMSRGKIGLITS